MRTLALVSLVSLVLASLVFASSAPSAQEACSTIQSGGLRGSDGSLLSTGFDAWGYNYEARMFNGGYCDAYRGAAWCQPWADVELIMKWNDAWLSNRDCGGDGLSGGPPDGKLDRYFGFARYKGSGAWTTNHQSGLVDVGGKLKRWTYFVKIVAAPASAVRCAVEPSYWCEADGQTAIGPVIWGDFAIVEEISNDPSSGQHGLLYKSPVAPGFGTFQP